MGRYSREDGYSRMMDGGYRGGSYRQDGSYRGYSRDDAKQDMLMQLREMEQDADDESRQMIRKWMKQVEER